MINTLRVFFMFVFSCSVTLAIAQKEGKILGIVRDAKTQEPLIGATVQLEGTGIGTITDLDGRYSISNIPPKTYNVKAALLSYKALVKYDVVITTGNTQNINFELEEAESSLGEVEVVASPFKQFGETPNSIQTLSRQEIQTYPGGNNDIAKVVQSLPGVSGSVGFRNDVIIRGGAPNENVYYLDGMEIPNINHFATQGSAGGPVGILNVSFIEDVTLTTSSFHSRYDNPLSGVLQFKQRTGNPDRLQGNFRVGASELAITGEGPLGKANSKTTFIGSLRRSYLQFLFRLIDLPFLPGFWDYQYKVTHKISNKDEINILGLGSIDDFSYNPPENPGPDADPDTRQRYFENLAILDQIPIFRQQTNTMGLSWKHLTENGFFTLTLSQNALLNTIEKYTDNDNSKPKLLGLKSLERENKLRFEMTNFLGRTTLSYGAIVQDAKYTNDFFQQVKVPLTDPEIIPPPIAISFNSQINFLRYGAFAQSTTTFFGQKLKLAIGARVDGNTFTSNGNKVWETFSPRAAASYNLSEKWSLNASIGRYYKIPTYTVLGFQDNQGQFVNRDNLYVRSDHLVAGLGFIPRNSTRITVEGFYKYYNNYPVSVRDSISLANLGGGFGFVGNEAVRSVGLMRTYGVEVLVQQKLTKNFYGILAYTWYKSEATGFDTKQFRPTTWDNRNLISFTGGYKFPRNWEAGIRFRYLGDAPFTPIDTLASLYNYPVGGGEKLDFNRVNSLRLRAFNAMDLRVDKKWNFSKWALDLYIEIQNLYNSLNPTPPSFTLKRNPDGSIQTLDGAPYSPANPLNASPVFIQNTSGARLPTIGLIVEL